MQPLAVRSSLPRSYCLIILTYSNELRCYELLLWEVVGGYPSYLHINHRRNPHTQVPPNPPEILSLPRPIVHGQIDSLGLKQAGWGASGVGGLAMGQGPLSLTVASCHTNYGTLLSPFSMARSPNKPSTPPYARSRTRRVLHPVPAQRASSCPRGLPPPTPPILLANLPEAKRGNTRNIIRGSTTRVRPQGPASGPLAQASAASSSAGRTSMRSILRRVFSPSSPGKYSP